MGARIASVAAFNFPVTSRTTWTFARVSASDGSKGWGEATLEGRAAQVVRAIEERSGALRGREVAAAPALGPIPGDIVEAAAYSALEQAWWDLAARVAGRSEADLLGGARRAVAEGFGAVKIAPFDGVSPESASAPQGRALIAAGLDRVAAAARAIAGRAELQVDCHWRLSEAAAAETIAACSRMGVTWFECPLPEVESNHAAIARLRSRANDAGMRLAGAEHFVGASGFAPLLERGLYDVVMPDVKYAGGLAECLRIAASAARHGVACSLHNPSGPVAHAHSLHLSAVLEGAERLEYQHDESPLFYAIAQGLRPPRDGAAEPPPGLRIDLP